MLLRNLCCVFVIAILVTQNNATAGEAGGSSVQPTAGATDSGDCFGFNGFGQFRHSPEYGMPGSAGSGYQHFTYPMHNYTTWYRPRAATLNQCVRCAPDSFRPRGFGHLFARPCDGYRMEYSPHVLTGDNSLYGPSYIARQPDPRCEHCDPQASGHHH
jgi:hypothetical protein